MENYSYSSYPDSRGSSPRSREIETENHSWDEPPSSNAASATTTIASTTVPTATVNPAATTTTATATATATAAASATAAATAAANNFKVKFMCSYGGKIQPRPHDNQLAYFGGDTKILAVDRNIKFAALMVKLSSFSDAEVCFKYQLPGEDLDALISVTNDEDLEHMMLEYDRLYQASAKPARLRLFLFPSSCSAPTSFGSAEIKSERQWFVDALNSVQVQNLEGSSPPAPVTAGNPDFLFGLDKGYSAIPASKSTQTEPPPTVPEVSVKDLSAVSDCESEDPHGVHDQVVSPAEIQRQIHELQKLQIANSEQNLQRKIGEANANGNSGAYSINYYSSKNPEKMAPPQASIQVPLQVQLPAGTYMSERHTTAAGFPMAAAAGSDLPLYLIPTPNGMYQATGLRPVTGPMGQSYYGLPRMVPTEMYNAVPQAPLPYAQTKHGAYTENTVMAQQKVGVAEGGCLVGYDTAGRPVYYKAGTPGEVMQQYQVVSCGIDGRQGVNAGSVASNQEVKVAANKVSPASAV